MPGSVSYVVPSPDSRTYLFSAQGGGTEDAGGAGAGPGMYTINEDGTRLTRLNTTTTDAAAGGPRTRWTRRRFGGGSEPQWSRDSRGIYFLQGGGIYTLPVAGGPAADTAAAAAGGRGGRGGRGGTTTAAPSTETATAGAAPRRIPLSVKMEIDVTAERRQVFEEAWRVMKNRFYDPKMHGVNWAAAKDKYEAMLPHIADTEELHNLIMEMIGDMNASHTGITGGSRLPTQGPPEERIATRYPGFDLEPDSSGFYKVGYIYRKGPADHDYVKIAPGNFILSVNGKELKTSENYWKLFNILPGRKFEFLVNSKPATDGAWTIDLEPLTGAAMSNLQYDRWVEDRKQMVAKLTNGEIGYLHIKAMDAPSLAKFQRDLLENQDKKSLIIDQRFNGGGGIDQELLQILNQRKAYQVTRGRDSLDVKRPGFDVLRADGGAAERAVGERCGDVPGWFPCAGTGQAGGSDDLGAGDRNGVFHAAGWVGDSYAGRGCVHGVRREYGKLRSAAGCLRGQYSRGFPGRARPADREGDRDFEGAEVVRYERRDFQRRGAESAEISAEKTDELVLGFLCVFLCVLCVSALKSILPAPIMPHGIP